jgi:heme-degrading monooxygenase HmoA
VIVAFSRFRVANGLEDDVRDAFRNRPHLVDDVPGFLGLEAFSDAGDASLFYLITRWTDADSFKRWHSGPDHKQAHTGIPKGLKLDASFTLIRTLERISDPGEAVHPDAVRDSARLISEFLAHGTRVHWLKARSDGVIAASNRAIAEIAGGASDSLNGAVIWSFLSESDAAILRGAVESGNSDPAKRYHLNFTGPGQMAVALECQVDVQPDGFVLIGESVQRDELALQCELMALNNQYTVLLRENDRKAKALRKANAQLEKALTDLVESHWHLRKIQEVLPICMSCGKVKTGDSKWEEVLEYLKRNSLFLSHGYCPPCLAKEMEKLQRAPSCRELNSGDGPE